MSKTLDASTVNLMMTQSFFEKMLLNCASDTDIQLGYSVTQELLCYRKFQLFNKYQKDYRMKRIKLLQKSVLRNPSKKNLQLKKRILQLQEMLQSIQDAKSKRYLKYVGKDELNKWKASLTKRVTLDFKVDLCLNQHLLEKIMEIVPKHFGVHACAAFSSISISRLEQQKIRVQLGYETEAMFNKTKAKDTEKLQLLYCKTLTKFQNKISEFSETVVKKTNRLILQEDAKPYYGLYANLRSYILTLRKYIRLVFARDLCIWQSESLDEEFQRRFHSGLVFHDGKEVPLPRFLKNIIEDRQPFTDYTWNQFLSLPLSERNLLLDKLMMRFIKSVRSCEKYKHAAMVTSKLNKSKSISWGLVQMRKNLRCFRNRVFLCQMKDEELRLLEIDSVSKHLQENQGDFTYGQELRIEKDPQDPILESFRKAFVTKLPVVCSSVKGDIHLIPITDGITSLLLEFGEKLDPSEFSILDEDVFLAQAYLISIQESLNFKREAGIRNDLKMNIQSTLESLNERNKNSTSSAPLISTKKLFHKFFGHLRPVSLALVHYDSLEFFTDTVMTHGTQGQTIERSELGGQITDDFDDSNFEKCLRSGSSKIAYHDRKSKPHWCDIMTSSTDIMYTLPVFTLTPTFRRLMRLSCPLTAIVQFTMPIPVLNSDMLVSKWETTDRRVENFDINDKFTQQTLSLILAFILHDVESTSTTRDRLKPSLTMEKVVVTRRSEAQRKTVLSQYMARMMNRKAEKQLTQQTVVNLRGFLWFKSKSTSESIEEDPLSTVVKAFKTRLQLKMKLQKHLMYYYKTHIL